MPDLRAHKCRRPGEAGCMRKGAVYWPFQTINSQQCGLLRYCLLHGRDELGDGVAEAVDPTPEERPAVKQKDS